MTDDELQNLQPGDLIRGKVDGEAYVVTANYGSHVTAVRTADLTNPIEWDIIQKAAQPKNED